MHDSRRTRLVLGTLLAVALALITLDFRGGTAWPVRELRALGGTIFGSAESMTHAVTGPVAAFFDNVTSTSSQQGKITALERQVVSLRAQLSMAQLSKAQAAQLQRLLQLSGRGGYRVVAANVVAAGASYENTVTIDAGSSDGIKPEETVLNGDGLVGTVTAVSPHTSTVVLTTDAASTVGVRVAGAGERGAITGAGRTAPGPALLRLQVFNANALLRPGQQVVTFGSVHGRPYVPGVPVGVITQVLASPNTLTKLALVRPYADDSALGVVGVVIVPPRTNPRDSVLPPAPAPTGGHSSPTASPSATPSTGG